MKCLVLDVGGEFAHFRKHYTTTSPLSFPFPPRPTVAGILGAILGISRKELPRLSSLDRTKIGVQILQPGYTIVLKENWRQGPARIRRTKKGSSLATGDLTGPPAQITMEVLRKVKYRFFVRFSNEELHHRLKVLLENGQSHFTPSLGHSEFLCTTHYVGEFTLKVVPDNVQSLTIITVTTENQIKRLEFEVDKQYYELIMPLAVDENRKFQYIRCLLERTGSAYIVEKTKNSQFYSTTVNDKEQTLSFLE